MTQIFFDDIEMGTEIPSLRKCPTKRQLVKWAGASDDYNEPHYDKDEAIARGLPGVIVHGRLKAAFLGQMFTDWMGEKGKLEQFSCRFRGIDQPGEELICGGKVVEKYTRDGKNYIKCEIWLENTTRKARTVDGTALISLPARNA